MRQVRETSLQIDPEVLALAFQASGDLFKVLDADGTILAINVSGAHALGFESACDAVGKNWFELLPDDHSREVAGAAMEAAQSGQKTNFRLARGVQGGLPIWLDSTITPVVAEGRTERFLVVSRDLTEQYSARQALDRSNRLYAALIEATSEIVWHVDLSNSLTTRTGYFDFTGWPDDPRDMDGWLAAVHPEDHVRAKVAADAAAVSGSTLSIEYRLRHRSGEWRWVEDHATPVRDKEGRITDWVGIITDIHARKSGDQALRRSLEHLRVAVEATGLGTWDVDMRTGHREWSPELFDLLRLPRDTQPDPSLVFDRIHPDDKDRVASNLQFRGGRDGKSDVGVFRLLLDDVERWIEAHERTFFDTEGVPLRRVGTFQDITERKQTEIKAWLAAHTDALTGLANRALFHKRLERAVEEARSAACGLILLIIDLDRFKEVNDSLGHDAGDALLRTTAERILRTVPAAATVARLGGDEFCVLVSMMDGQIDPDRLCADLLAVLNTLFIYDGREVECSASLGWSSFPEQADEPSALLKNADVALYAAKSAGRSRVARYAPAMKHRLERRLNVLRHARDALANDGIVPFYQPKVELRTGRIKGFEALLRWRDRGRLHAPGLIQEALDDPEWSSRLGARMLERTMLDAAEWNAAGVSFGHVALNVATGEFQAGLSSRVLETLERTGVRPEQLEIEVTERVLLDDGGGGIGVTLRELHEAGVLIALDDFGTGYASLTHLTQFPVSWIKVDRSFTFRLGDDAGATAIIKAVIDLAHSLQIKVVAEGIETPSQLGLLKRANCDLGQGYLFAKPMAGSRVPYFLKQWQDRALEAPLLPLFSARQAVL